MKSSRVRFDSVDAYLAAFPEETRRVLAELRSTIKSAAPGVEETISYQMPTFTIQGQYLIYVAAWNKHIAMYPIPSGSEALQKELMPFIHGKGTLKFPLDKPLPLKLIRKIVKARLSEYLNS